MLSMEYDKIEKTEKTGGVNMFFSGGYDDDFDIDDRTGDFKMNAELYGYDREEDIDEDEEDDEDE